MPRPLKQAAPSFDAGLGSHQFRGDRSVKERAFTVCCIKRCSLILTSCSTESCTTMFTSNSSLPAQALDIADTCPIEEFLFNEAYGRHKIIQSRNPLTCGVTGKTYSFSDLRQRVDFLARGLAQNLGWQPNKGTQWQKVICVYSANSVLASFCRRNNALP